MRYEGIKGPASDRSIDEKVNDSLGDATDGGILCAEAASMSMSGWSKACQLFFIYTTSESCTYQAAMQHLEIR